MMPNENRPIQSWLPPPSRAAFNLLSNLCVYGCAIPGCVTANEWLEEIHEFTLPTAWSDVDMEYIR